MMTASGMRWSGSWRNYLLWLGVSALLCSLDQRRHPQATQHPAPQLHLHPRHMALPTLRHTQLLPVASELILACNSGNPSSGLKSPIGFNLGSLGEESSSEKCVPSLGSLKDIDGEARSTVKERSIALKKKDKVQRENEAKMKEKQKKLKQMS